VGWSCSTIDDQCEGVTEATCDRSRSGFSCWSPHTQSTDLTIGKLREEMPSVQVRPYNYRSDKSLDSTDDSRWTSPRLSKHMAFSNRSFHNLRHPQQEMFLALNEAAGYGYRVGNGDRAARAVMALGQQMVADRQRPVPPVHRASSTEHAQEIRECDPTP